MFVFGFRIRIAYGVYRSSRSMGCSSLLPFAPSPLLDDNHSCPITPHGQQTTPSTFSVSSQPSSHPFVYPQHRHTLAGPTNVLDVDITPGHPPHARRRPLGTKPPMHPCSMSPTATQHHLTRFTPASQRPPPLDSIGRSLDNEFFVAPTSR